MLGNTGDEDLNGANVNVEPIISLFIGVTVKFSELIEMIVLFIVPHPEVQQHAI